MGPNCAYFTLSSLSWQRFGIIALMTPDQGIRPTVPIKEPTFEDLVGRDRKELSGKPFLTIPNREQIARVSKFPKVEFVPVAGRDVFVSPDIDPDLSIASVRWRYDLVDALAGKLEEKFGHIDRDELLNTGDLDNAFHGNVAIRATACSLDGRIAYTKTRPPLRPWGEPREITVNVGSIEDLLDGRTEYGISRVYVEPINVRDKQRPRPLGWYVSNYLYTQTINIRRSLIEHGPPDSEEAVYPVLMVYDMSFCHGNFSDGYRVHLPTEDDTAPEAVLGAFLYPIPTYFVDLEQEPERI